MGLLVKITFEMPEKLLPLRHLE